MHSSVSAQTSQSMLGRSLRPRFAPVHLLVRESDMENPSDARVCVCAFNYVFFFIVPVLPQGMMNPSCSFTALQAILLPYVDSDREEQLPV